MKRRNHKGGAWKPYTPSYSNDVAVNNPFAGLKFVRIIQRDVVDSTSRSSEHSAKKFKPPIGPKHLPLSQCPNLAALLHQRDRSEMEKIAKSLLAKPHDNGFKITLEPRARLEFREIYGERQETFASWHIVVRRDWKDIKGNCKWFKSEYSLRVDDNRVLASALYLADLLNAKTDKIHLFKPFRPSAYIEAWLEQEKSKNPALVAKMKEVAGKVYVYQKDGALSASGMKPVALFVGSTEYSLKNWRDLIVKTCDILDKENRKLLRELSFRIGDAFLSEKSDGMRTPKLHESSGLYMEMNLPAYSHILHSQLLFRKFQYNLDEIGIVYVDKGVSGEGSGDSTSRRRPSKKDTQELSGEELETFQEITQDLMANYPSGFDFKETSMRLVESRIGKEISETLVEALRSLMFERSDGMWLLSAMVINPDDLMLMINRAKEMLDGEGAFAMDSLFSEFEGSLRNVLCGRDFKLFFDRFMAEKVSGKVRGHEGWRVCFKDDVAEEDGWATIGLRVRQFLQDSGDAVTIDDILFQMSHLDREVVLRVCQEHIKDAIVFTTDQIEYVKLLEAYYLPDDFCDILKAFIERTETNHNVVSVVLLEAELNSKYGDGFRVNFGLEDDVVFKQVVASSFSDNQYSWKKDVFIAQQQKMEANVAEVFLRTHDGIFHEEDFFRFAYESRGMKNRGMLILTFLRKYCIRLSKEWWISKSVFDNNFTLTDEQCCVIGNALNSALGNNAFMPILSLSNDFYESLPTLSFDGKIYQWNPYLLTSVAVSKIKNASVVNDEPSPYTVTAQILPHDKMNVFDIVEYTINSYPRGYFDTADSAYDLLRKNYVRTTKTEKLMSKINRILKVL